MAPVIKHHPHRAGEWANLPPDTIMAIARAVASNGGGSLAAFRRTCAAWRMSISDEENDLWRGIALNTFPRLNEILRLSEDPNLPFQVLYARQARAERQSLQLEDEPKGPDLDAFIFTFEVRYKGQMAGQWSGNIRLEDLVSPETPVLLWETTPSWFECLFEDVITNAEQDDGLSVDAVVVAMFVTYNMQTARIFSGKTCFDEDEDEDENGILPLRVYGRMPASSPSIPMGRTMVQTDGVLYSSGRFVMEFYDDLGHEAAEYLVAQGLIYQLEQLYA